MATLTQTSSTPSLSTTNGTFGLVAAYQRFVEKAEFTRFGWVCTGLMIQGCVLTPALLFSMHLFGGGDWQFFVASLCFLLLLIPTLSAVPMKYLFAFFGLSAAIQLSIILLNVF